MSLAFFLLILAIAATARKLAACGFTSTCGANSCGYEPRRAPTEWAPAPVDGQLQISTVCRDHDCELVAKGK